MNSSGELRINPGAIEIGPGEAELEVVVAYTDDALASAVLKRAPQLTAGLNAKLLLLAVHTVPFPMPYTTASASHTHLVNKLIELAEESPMPVTPHIVMARSRQEGFRYVLKPESTVLVGTRRHFWQTPEEQLARALALDGHKVALLHIE